MGLRFNVFNPLLPPMVGSLGRHHRHETVFFHSQHDLLTKYLKYTSSFKHFSSLFSKRGFVGILLYVIQAPVGQDRADTNSVHFKLLIFYIASKSFLMSYKIPSPPIYNHGIIASPKLFTVSDTVLFLAMIAVIHNTGHIIKHFVF